jgi:glycine/D-amino acid oxidase-like deaminating enzyme
MINKADVIVIGSGALGAATAYYLTKRKGLAVAVIDKHDIGSQTSPRAAGMVSCARKSDLMISLIKDACRKIEAFTEETGQPLDWVHSGSLKIARRPRDGEVIEADFNRGRRMGLDVELISSEQASRLNPFLTPTGVVAAMRIGDDRYFDPAQVAVGFARAAAARGATLLPNTDVLAVNIEAHKVTGVTTAKGTIEAPTVVDAAGAWTRQVAEASGLGAHSPAVDHHGAFGWCASRPANGSDHGRRGVHAPMPGRVPLGCLRGSAALFRYAIVGGPLRYQGHAA